MNNQLVCIRQFKESNPEFDWLHFRSWDKEEFNQLIGNQLHQKTKPYKDERIQVLITYQTMFKLCQDDYWAELLIVSGFKSILQIANFQREEFIQVVSPLFNTNLPMVHEAGFSKVLQAEAIHTAAVNRVNTLLVNSKRSRLGLNLMIA